MLFGTMAEAEMLKSFIDSAGCGESCRRDHLTVELKSGRRRSWADRLCATSSAWLEPGRIRHDGG